MAQEKWTATDEAALNEMQVRRALVLSTRRKAVEDVVDRFGFGGMYSGDVVDGLIANAEAVRDVLAPYDSGVRAENTKG